jgi:tetratricopeptide (TPR) repeat protein
LALRWLECPERTAAEDLALGWALLRWERFAPAEQALTTAAARLAPTDPAGLFARCALLMLAQMQGAGAELQLQWEAHVAACAAVANEPALLRARCEQIAHLNVLGRFVEARELVETLADRIDQAADGALSARYAHVAGVAATGCADLPAAKQLLAEAEVRFRQLGRRADIARVHFERGWLQIRREDLSAAAGELAQAQTIYRTLDLPFRVALCDRDLGTVAYLQGAYAQAIASGVAARTQFLALGRQYHAAGCDFNLGTVAHVSGLYDLAFAVYQRAEEAYLTHGDVFHAFVAGRNQVLAARAMGAPARALALADALESFGAELGDELGMSELRVARALALHDLDRTAEAVEMLQAAITRLDALGKRPAAAEAMLELALIYLDSGAHDAANELFATARFALADHPAHLWRVEHGLGRIAEQQGDYLGALTSYVTAAQRVAGLRRRLASEHASSGIFQQAQALYQNAITLAAQCNDHTALLTLADQQQSLIHDLQALEPALPPDLAAQREQASADLHTALADRSDPLRRDAALDAYITTLLHTRHVAPPPLEPLAPLELHELRSRLAAAFGADWTLLCPLFSADRLLLFGITPTATYCTSRAANGELNALLDRACLPAQRQMTYRDLGRLRRPDMPPWQTLTALGACLLPEWLTARLHPQHHLVIVPSGPLHSLAWAALRVEDMWLCERAILSILPNLRAAHTPVHLDPTVPGLLLGCSSFGGRAAPLPDVPEALVLAARHWPGPTEQWLDAAANTAAVRAAAARGELQRYGLIQIATHAQLGPVDGLLAHIKLADADLLIDDVRRLRLQADLVVLTTCEGGAGAVLPGDEVIGLSRALLIAGARQVLAGLWTLYDQGVLALLERFYTALAAGHDAPTALALAQRALSALPPQPDSMLHTPYLWGGFTVVLR